MPSRRRCLCIVSNIFGQITHVASCKYSQMIVAHASNMFKHALCLITSRHEGISGDLRLICRAEDSNKKDQTCDMHCMHWHSTSMLYIILWHVSGPTTCCTSLFANKRQINFWFLIAFLRLYQSCQRFQERKFWRLPKLPGPLRWALQNTWKRSIWRETVLVRNRKLAALRRTPRFKRSTWYGSQINGRYFEHV